MSSDEHRRIDQSPFPLTLTLTRSTKLVARRDGESNLNRNHLMGNGFEKSRTRLCCASVFVSHCGTTPRQAAVASEDEPSPLHFAAPRNEDEPDRKHSRHHGRISLLVRVPIWLSLTPCFSRNDSIKNGERDRPGRSSRRLAGWSSRMNDGPNSYPKSRQKVCGQRPQTAGERHALPKSTAWQGVNEITVNTAVSDLYSPVQ
jgi:hypothetical protein